MPQPVPPPEPEVSSSDHSQWLDIVKSKYPLKGVTPKVHDECFRVLYKKLPAELALQILDLAGFWQVRTESVDFGTEGKALSFREDVVLASVPACGKVREVLLVGWVKEALNEFRNDVFGDTSSCCTFQLDRCNYRSENERRGLPLPLNLRMPVDGCTKMIFRHWHSTLEGNGWDEVRKGDVIDARLTGNYEWAANVGRFEFAIACSYS